MSIPKAALDVVRVAIQNHPDSIDDCLVEADKNIRQLSCYSEFVEELVTNAIRELVYDERHRINWKIRAGTYKCTPKVLMGDSEGIAEVHWNEYSFCIAGRSLGSILGSELEDIALTEESQARGHTANATLCRNLMKLVRPNQTVREAVKLPVLKKLFQPIAAHFTAQA